jgi:hypothetical protein
MLEANPGRRTPGGKHTLSRHVILDRQTDLFQVIHALSAARSLPRGLHRRQEQRNQDPNDGDHDEQFHERETL